MGPTFLEYFCEISVYLLLSFSCNRPKKQGYFGAIFYGRVEIVTFFVILIFAGLMSVVIKHESDVDTLCSVQSKCFCSRANDSVYLDWSKFR